MSLENIENEKWKDVPYYEGYYMVSNYGRVKSVERVLFNVRRRVYHSQILKQTIKLGYMSVTLNKEKKFKSFSVHRLVGMAFIPNPDNLECINHKNEIKTDNRVENLEWCTKQYNSNYGTSRQRASLALRNNQRVSYPVLQYDIHGKFINEYPSMGEAKRQTGVLVPNIKACFAEGIKRQYTAGGYIWILKNGKVTVENILEEIYGPKKSAICVDQYTKDGVFIKTYDSMNKAHFETGLSVAGISRCVNGITKEEGGFIWKKSKKHAASFKKKVTPVNCKISVEQYTKDGVYIKTYQSITEAANSIGVCHSSIRQCLKGVTRHCGGYGWKVSKRQDNGTERRY